MPVVMESDHFTIVFINSGCGNDRTTKITQCILQQFWDRRGWVWHKHKNPVGVHDNISPSLFEGRPDFGFHFIKQSRAKSIA